MFLLIFCGIWYLIESNNCRKIRKICWHLTIRNPLSKMSTLRFTRGWVDFDLNFYFLSLWWILARHASLAHASRPWSPSSPPPPPSPMDSWCLQVEPPGKSFLLNLSIRCLYVLCLMGSFWLLELLPIPVTSLLPVVLFPLLGIMNTAEVGIL